MFNIYDNNLIDMNRGDSKSFPIFINKGSGLDPVRYILEPNIDKVCFYLMDAQETFENALLTKELTSEDLDSNGDIIISFKPDDTLGLEEGVYFFEIKLFHYNIKNEEEIFTIVPKRRFTILN